MNTEMASRIEEGRRYDITGIKGNLEGMASVENQNLNGQNNYFAMEGAGDSIILLTLSSDQIKHVRGINIKASVMLKTRTNEIEPGSGLYERCSRALTMKQEVVSE